MFQPARIVPFYDDRYHVHLVRTHSVDLLNPSRTNGFVLSTSHYGFPARTESIRAARETTIWIAISSLMEFETQEMVDKGTSFSSVSNFLEIWLDYTIWRIERVV